MAIAFNSCGVNDFALLTGPAPAAEEVFDDDGKVLERRLVKHRELSEVRSVSTSSANPRERLETISNAW